MKNKNKWKKWWSKYRKKSTVRTGVVYKREDRRQQEQRRIQEQKQEQKGSIKRTEREQRERENRERWEHRTIKVIRCLPKGV